MKFVRFLLLIFSSAMDIKGVIPIKRANINLLFGVWTFKKIHKTKKTPNFNHQIFIEILLLSTVSQIGDIIISYFKRLSKVKDTGKIIPGHGGMLDRIDGMIFAFPFSYLIFKTNLIQIF